MKKDEKGNAPWLLTAATAMELSVCLDRLGQKKNLVAIVTGVGPLETAVRLCSWLHRYAGAIQGVCNIGVAGAYVVNGSGPTLLDLCLASREVLGDLGVCDEERVLRLDAAQLKLVDSIPLDVTWSNHVAKLLSQVTAVHRGTFVTVNCASGSVSRAEALGRDHGAICENMEGAAVARVCVEWRLPCVEVRCISNLAGEQDKRNWRLVEAAEKGGIIMAEVLDRLLEFTKHDG